MTGTITTIKLDKGFGFIAPSDGGPDLFWHVSTLQGLEFDEQLVGRHPPQEEN